MKRVLVFPGSEAQIPLIMRLKYDGYEVICINPNNDTPGIEYADYYEKGDILNKENSLYIAKKYRVDAVISDECDIAMPTVAYIGEQLHLETLTVRDADLYTDKFQMREFSKENGFNYPEFEECATVEHALDFYKKIGKKAIIKPLDSNSSRGVYIIKNESDLEKYFPLTLQFSKRRKAVICEEFIDGIEFTVDGIMLNNQHHSLVISQKKHYAYNTNIACELFFSHYNQEFNYNLLREINDSYVEKTGLKFGFTHAEYKFQSGKYYLIEIGARGGGNFISSHIVPVLTGIDNYNILIQRSLGTMVEADFEIDEAHLNRCAVLKFFDIENEGTVKSIRNVELLSQNENIIMYKFRVGEGEYIAKADNDSKRVGFYIAYGESRDELLNLIELISNNVKIIVE